MQLFLCKIASMKLIFASILVFFLSCKPPSGYFKTANDVQKKEALVYFNNGSVVKGKLTVLFENNFNYNNERKVFVKFSGEGMQEEKLLDIHEIKGYSIDSNFYMLKYVDLNVNASRYLLFVKRLTRETDKLQLYQLHQEFSSNYTGEVQDFYYISFPYDGPLETTSASSIKLVPDFEHKMSSLLEDCPELATKIRSRKSGYTLPLVSFATQKKLEVLSRIVNEYNHCK